MFKHLISGLKNAPVGVKNPIFIGLLFFVLLIPIISFADTLLISADVASPGGGGGGGGGGGYSSPTSVIFSGRAYPLSRISLLQDGQVVLSTIAGPDAKFSMTLTGLSTGSYTFSIVGEDNRSLRSTLFTVPIYITSGSTITVSGIFLAPTIDVDKQSVIKGDNLTIFGQTVPTSDVVISVHSNPEFFYTVSSDSSGAYLYTLDTSALDIGSHATKSKTSVSTEGLISPYGAIVGFQVALNGLPPLIPTPTCRIADLNCDGRVNLIDFSILAFWYKKTGIPVKVDLNHDNQVTIVDFSIMAYYWTG